jgi:hypothetical protein
MVAANLHDAVSDTLLLPPSRTLSLRSGLRVGVVGVLSPRLRIPPQVPEGSIEIRDPLVAAQAAVDGLRANVEVVVLLAHMSRGESTRLAESLKGVDVVVQGHDGQAIRKIRRWGEAYVVQSAAKGLHVGVAYATIGPDGRVSDLSNAQVGLDTRFADDAGIAKLFAQYDIDIAEREKIAPASADASVVSYAGAEVCQRCHAQIQEKWKLSRHAHAFEVLTAQNRQFDRDCTPCHTTGFAQPGGFSTAAATPTLAGVQCEACHGNAAAHAQDPTKRTRVVARSTCRDCHTAEQTPDFDFATFWARIDHGGSSGARTGSP